MAHLHHHPSTRASTSPPKQSPVPQSRSRADSAYLPWLSTWGQSSCPGSRCQQQGQPVQEEGPGRPSPLPGAPPWAGREHLPVGPPPDALGLIVSVSRRTQELLRVCACVSVCVEAGAGGCISQTTHVHTGARGNTHVPIFLPAVVVVEEVLGSVQHHRPIFKQQKKVFMPMCSTEYCHVGGPWAREQSRTKPERVQTL